MKRFRMSAGAYTLAALSFLATACSDDNDGDGDAAPPTISEFAATPDALTATTDVSLTWTVTGADTISIDPEIGRVEGSSLTTRVYAPTRFVLTATNAAGSASRIVDVTMTLPVFSASVDTSLAPGRATLSDGQPIVSSADAQGVQSDFVLDEVRIRPRNQEELDAFVARVGGQVVGDNSIPDAPAELQRTTQADPQEFLVRFDSTGYSSATLTTDAARAGLGGAMRFSSEHALSFFARVTHEAASGIRVWPNFMVYGDALLTATNEITDVNAFDGDDYPRYQSDGSRSHVVQAWQWVQAHGTVKAPVVAVIDGGFYLDTAGNAIVYPGDLGDFPARPTQYDFVNDDYNADGMNPNSCTGGTPCPWHGNRSAAVATARVNNGGGGAGTGGTVATPWMFLVDGTKQQTERAVRTAHAWGADVINMSFGGACNLPCRQYDRDTKAFPNAIAAGVVIVASAGNDTKNVRADNFYHPCIIDQVICVGALGNNVSTPINYSNFGAGLVWASTNIFASPDPEFGAGFIPNHSGTSAAAPFVAGIVAMMKAIDPSLNASRTVQILRDTAFTDSSNPWVTHMVNALKAVQSVSNGVLPPDALESNDTAAEARPLASGLNQDLRVSVTGADRDYYTINAPSKSSVTVDLTWATGIGNLVVLDGGLSSAGACGLALQRTNTATANGRSITYSLPAGTHTLGLGAATPVPYDVSLTVTSAIGGTYLSAYEPNDSLATAAGIDNPSIVKATTGPGDNDFYSVYGTGTYANGPLNMQNVAQVLGADAPVTITVYDSTNAVVGSATTSADCATPARVSIPVGSHRIGVTSTSTTDYIMYVGGKVTSVEQYITTDAFTFQLDPGDRFEVILPDYEQWFVLEAGSDFAIDRLQILTPDVHATTFTLGGALLYEGTSVDGVSEVVQAPVSLTSEPILLRLSRVVTGEPGATPTAITVSLEGLQAE